MNPILFATVFFVDAAGGNIADSGAKGTLLERTPFAYVYFWPAAFLPDDPAYDGAELLLVIIGNTIFYSVFGYFILTCLRNGRNKIK